MRRDNEMRQQELETTRESHYESRDIQNVTYKYDVLSRIHRSSKSRMMFDRWWHNGAGSRGVNIG
jgi:hypothetical protein